MEKEENDNGQDGDKKKKKKSSSKYNYTFGDFYPGKSHHLLSLIPPIFGSYLS